MEKNSIDTFEIELYLEEYIGKIYKRFRQYKNFEKEKEFRKHLKEKYPHEVEINPYQLYTLKILDLLDEEFRVALPFDQYSGFSSIKSRHIEGNMFMSLNEIHSIAEELSIKLQNKIITENIISRVKTLCLQNVLCPLIDFDAFIGDIEHSDIYYEEVKVYLKSHKKYMRYARLIKAAIYNAKLHEHPDILPYTEDKLIEFITSPFIYVMLEPYNFILKDKINELEELDILLHSMEEPIQGLIIDGEIEFTVTSRLI
jgi:hypothetical protein